MAQVSIVMGSDSDMAVMEKSANILKKLGIETEMRIISAHREPEELVEYAKGAVERGIKVIIAGAGKAAALPGMCAAVFPLPVIGVPIKTSDLGGVDSLYSIVQMPSGVPVASVAINGAENAGLLAAQILSVSDEGIRKALAEDREARKKDVMAKDAAIRQ
ncbi:MAG: 5-(carboxyamino)imidazole ribonucleotide mutase [Lachnospiraceae bacterium]|nr:5-(carboxyamino)imidazole ribonucleotide mutase [Lachnospiraceae bacterium]